MRAMRQIRKGSAEAVSSVPGENIRKTADFGLFGLEIIVSKPLMLLKNSEHSATRLNSGIFSALKRNCAGIAGELQQKSHGRTGSDFSIAPSPKSNQT
jgi:hypothetical protein